MWRSFVRGGVPKTVKLPAAQSIQLVEGEALPFTEMLFGEVGDLERFGAGDRLRSHQTGVDDR